MNVYFVLTFCFIPFILVFILCRLFIRIKISTELIAGLFGLLAVLPITFLQFFLSVIRPLSDNDLPGLFLKVLLFDGLLEEMIKMFFLVLLPSKKLELKEFFASALLCGLCLGCFESSVYFFQHLQEADARGAQLLYRMIFMRIFSSDLIHMFCAGLSGLFIWGCRHKKFNLMPLIFAVLTHGLFNFFAYFNNNIRWFSVAAVLFAVIECRIRYMNLAPEKPKTVRKTKSHSAGSAPSRKKPADK